MDFKITWVYFDPATEHMAEGEQILYETDWRSALQWCFRNVPLDLTNQLTISDYSK